MTWRERLIARATMRCRHLEGTLVDGVCRKGLDIRAVAGGSNEGWGTRVPCIETNFTDHANVATCPLRDRPSRAEAEAEITARHDRLLASFARMMDERLCPHCDQRWTGVQRKGCVYCDACGLRLYRGTLPREERWGISSNAT